MTLSKIYNNAEEDSEARKALWKAIFRATEDVRARHRIRSIKGIENSTVFNNTIVPELPTWQLIEALSLLGVILRSENASADVINIFGKTGPIEILEDGIVRYLWAQQTLKGEMSSLNGRPDLIITSNSELPHPSNAIRIIEAKCIRQMGIHIIRSEFGKAQDLRVSSYLIWSFYSPTPNVVAGARGLGIDLESIGFDTERREDLIKSPEALIAHIAYSQEQARKAQRFAKALSATSEEIKKKLLSPF